jgi:hypothetical protein
VKMCEDFAANFGDIIKTTHRLPLPFSLGILSYKKKSDGRFLPTLLFFVSSIEDETERPPF